MLALGLTAAAGWLDLPKAHIDDLYYVQTAVTHLAMGRIDNTAFTQEFRQGLTPDRDFGQLPFYSFFLSHWMGFLGTSAASLQLFFLLFLCFGVFSLLDLSRKLGVNLFFSSFCAAVFALSLSLFGFRMDVVSFFLFLGGWRILMQGSSWACFAGLGIFAASAAVYPSGFFFGLPVFFHQYYRDILEPRLLGSWKGWMPIASALFWFAGFFFLMQHLIAGDWGHFFRDYRISAQQAVAGMPFSWEKYQLAWQMGTERSFFFPKMGFVLLAFVLVGLLFCIGRHRRAPVPITVPCLLLMLGILLNAGLVPLKFRLFAAGSAILAGWALSGFFQLAKSWKGRLLALVFLSVYGTLAVPALVYGLMQAKPAPYQLSGIIVELQRKGYAVLVDANAARYGLDWKLPAGVGNFFTSRSVVDPDPLKRILPRTWQDFHDREIAILSWNDSLAELAGEWKFSMWGPLRLPVSATKSDVFFVSRQGVLGSVYDFKPETLPALP